jgi:hypothetical protein
MRACCMFLISVCARPNHVVHLTRSVGPEPSDVWPQAVTEMLANMDALERMFGLSTVVTSAKR